MKERNRLCGLVAADPGGASWSVEVRDHAAACAACQAFLASQTELGRRLRALPSATEAMPQELRAVLLAQLAACEPSSATDGARSAARGWAHPVVRRIALPLALAASLAMGMVLERRLATRDSGLGPQVNRTIGMYIQDVTHDHYLLERLTRPLEVHLTDRDELSRWLSSSLSFGFDLPHVGSGFALEGGRVWHTVGRLSALASYVTADSSRAMLFAVPAANLDLRGAPSSLIHGIRVYTGSAWGHEAHVWIEGDLAVALTAPDGKLPAIWVESFLP